MEWTSFFSLFHAKHTSKNFDDNKVATLAVKPEKINELAKTIKLYSSVQNFLLTFFAKSQITAKLL